MKALGYTQKGAISEPSSVVEFETDQPTPGAGDLLVEVLGVSVNPVDVKVRANRRPPGDAPRILGFDAAGIVRQTGAAVKGFKPGDAVFYAGEFTRPGSNAAFQVVDERLVGRKPNSLGFAEAAALPLTSITAWEILFDCFRVAEGGGAGDAVLIIGGAGGVGSILIQLAKQLTGLTVIATASRDDTRAWVTKMGADHVIDHHKPLDAQVADLGLHPRYVASLNQTGRHFAAIVELIQPRGHISLIDDPQGIDITAIKLKALTLSWEFMFARSMFQTDDMQAQGDLLGRVSALVDEGRLVTTANRHLGPLTGDSLRAALTEQDSGAAIGKIVLDGLGNAAG
ncbi:zinc-binding alcohol dehydrogenase family protein [Antarctobacter sp.]|uniref:zinc-binding alcohol dehydrogenase family protein n=1 Tax=Antarctobacter sp. TaxID=1872577 RepID=UPI002B279832|nr:zinc-binding alcohol dehydrogenase family protein [Antarctobacter sp.]